jgi:hypothetical protein
MTSRVEEKLSNIMCKTKEGKAQKGEQVAQQRSKRSKVYLRKRRKTKARKRKKHQPISVA